MTTEREALDEAREALAASSKALDDWTCTYASEFCDPEHVNDAWKRIQERGGTLSYIADTNARNRAALDKIDAEQAASAQPQEPTEAMVTAYLQANDAYWREVDSMPTAQRNPSKWRNGTPSEATRVGLRAALAIAHPAQGPQSPAPTAAQAAVAWTSDAEGWGNALNDAAWVFIDACPEKSTLLFNNCKPALRAAILKYASLVAAPPTPQEPAQAAVLAAPDGFVLLPKNPRRLSDEQIQVLLRLENGRVAIFHAWEEIVALAAAPQPSPADGSGGECDRVR